MVGIAAIVFAVALLAVLIELRGLRSFIEALSSAKSAVAPIFSPAEILRCQREIKRLEARIAAHEAVGIEKNAQWVKNHAHLQLPAFLTEVEPLISEVCARKTAEEVLRRMLEINIAVANGTLSVEEGMKQASSVDSTLVYLKNSPTWKEELQNHWADAWRKAQA